MQTVGSVLREERLKQGLTLELISVQTKLPLRSLSAIESDDLSPFGSAFFYKSFVKQYASRIPVDYGEIAPLVEARAGEMPAPPLPGEKDRQLPDVPAIDPPGGSVTRWVLPTVALVAVLVGCSGIYARWEAQRAVNGVTKPVASLTAAPQSEKSAPPADAPAAGSGHTDASSNSRASNSPAETAPDPAPAAAHKSETAVTRQTVSSATGNEVQLELSALEPVWVSVAADGKSVFTGVLETRETKRIESRETAKILVGNAGGLKFVYNGRPVGPLGPHGQVLTAVFTRQNYQILSRQTAESMPPRAEPAKYPTGQ